MIKSKFLVAASLLALASASYAAVINEGNMSQEDAGSDFPYYIELYGTSSESLDGLSVVIVDQKTGNEGTVVVSYDLAGESIGANQYFLIGNATELGTVFSVTPDIDAAVTGQTDLGESFALLLMATADIPNSGVGPLTGSETIVDGIDFDGDGRSASPLSWTGVPLAPPDLGYTQAGFYRNTDGVDTDDISDFSYIAYQGGEFAATTNTTPTASAASSVNEWNVYE